MTEELLASACLEDLGQWNTAHHQSRYIAVSVMPNKCLASLGSSGSFPSARYCTIIESSFCELTILLKHGLGNQTSFSLLFCCSEKQKHKKHCHLVPLVILTKHRHLNLLYLDVNVKFSNNTSPTQPSSRWMLCSRHSSERRVISVCNTMMSKEVRSEMLQYPY